MVPGFENEIVCLLLLSLNGETKIELEDKNELSREIEYIRSSIFES